MAFRADRHAHIVIIGGGAIGTSVAYHLARDGAKDVLLLEKAQLTHGCTWHAAGLVGQLRGKKNLTRLMQNSVAVFDRLEAETGQHIAWKKVGSLRLAGSAATISRGIAENPDVRDALTFNVHWGLQRNLSKRWTLNSHFGVGYAIDATDLSNSDGSFYPALDLKFSYILNKQKR